MHFLDDPPVATASSPRHAAFAAVLATEREIKRQQVTLLVRIKNKLTPDQQAKLSDLRTKPPTK